MTIGNINNKQGNLNKNNNIIVPYNQKNLKNLQDLQDRLNRIIKEIGGIGESSSMSESILLAQDKIKKLDKETKEVWSSCPPKLAEKIKKLNQLNQELKIISESITQVNKDIDKKKPEIVTPGKENKEKLITDSLEIRAIYNSLPKSPKDNVNAIKKSLPENITPTQELKDSLQDIEKDDWDFSVVNAKDSKIFSKLKNYLVIGDTKNIINKQIEVIDSKLAEIKDKKGKFIPEVGVKLYEPEDTGKILALETAKLRRVSLNSKIILPDIDKNLVYPDILAQPSPGSTLFFKIDKRFIPSKEEIKEILEFNKPYKPILNKLFPDYLNIYMIPGYVNKKDGDKRGGRYIQEQPGQGILLHAYNVNDRYHQTSSAERIIAEMREINDLQPSVLEGNKDRARALAHEIGHAISYEMIKKDSIKHPSKPSSIIVNSSAGINFLDGWKSLRSMSRLNLNTNETKSNNTKNLSVYDKAKLDAHVDYEMIAEDIRMAIIGESLPASSAMTGIFDHTKEGKSEMDKSIGYLKKCLLENKTPIEAIMDNIKS
ncbi:MAG: hypothetical protein A2104_05650 [Candidatus Melainabacteria bacterium GWF2_32_7]|nr:MAG: hypothetical protein A2104_05650 [Candidatus Melainabacteria bacterium GWF2_32_7]